MQSINQESVVANTYMWYDMIVKRKDFITFYNRRLIET